MAHQACRICRSDPEVRSEIEEALVVEGKKFSEVGREWVDFFEINFHLLEQSIGTHFKKHLDPKITTEDLKLLNRIKEGTASFDEITRVLQAKALEKILRKPNSVKISDWLKSENLKIKKQKAEEKSNFALELLGKMFLGGLPAQNCIKCGHPFFENYAGVS